MILAAALLAAAIAAAVVRDRRAPDAAVALGGAVLLLVVGVLSWGDAWNEFGDLAPTLVVLASLLVLGEGCERAGVFDALAARVAAGARGSGPRLLTLVVGAAAPLAVLALTLAGFAVAGPLGLDAAWPAAAGALAMAATTIARERARATPRPRATARAAEGGTAARPAASPPATAATTHPSAASGPGPAVSMAATAARDMARAIDLRLLGFVLGLGLIVRALADHGLGDLVTDVLPDGTGLLPLLGAAALAAVLANVLNNVPAVLVLLPAAAAAGPETVLAVLIGVNVGPNLTYTGSLATLLWRGALRDRGEEPGHGEFHRLGALTVPPILVACTVALWLVS